LRKRRDRGPVALEAYETLAARYAAMVDEKPENAYYERPAVLSMLPHPGGMSVLDAGCGPGRYAEWLADHGADVTGIDVSPKMIRLARKRLGRRARLHVADLSKPLDFLETGSFDLVVAALVLDYVKDWSRLFTDFNRVLKQFGLLVFSCGHPFGDLMHRPEGNYFRTELTDYEWKGFGIPVSVPYYRRPLEAIFQAPLEAGFILESVAEPRAGEELRKRDALAYKRLSRVPGFIVIRCRKGT
jgi:SAM-dependent methyltransferase